MKRTTKTKSRVTSGGKKKLGRGNARVKKTTAKKAAAKPLARKGRPVRTIAAGL